jgi:hypothetical protein
MVFVKGRLHKMREEGMGDEKRRISEIKKKIAGFDLICPGTLMVRKKPCGRPNCRCASGRPEDLHGPYYEWNRYIDGRLAHKIVSQKQAEELKRAMDNQREVKALLHEWERESAEIILGTKARKG